MSDFFTDETLPRAYVASLSAYNDGEMLGDWFDWNDVPDSPREWVEALVERGQIVLTGPTDEQTAEIDDLALVHEELACHDHENYHGIIEGEPGLLDLDLAAKVIEEAKRLDLSLATLAAYRDFTGIDPLDADPLEAAADSYAGVYSSAAEFVETYHEGTEIPERLTYYIAWDRMARDWLINGDIYAHTISHDAVMIFTA